MSELLNVLGTHRESIARDLAGKLREAGGAASGQAHHDRCSAMLVALRESCRLDDAAAARTWAETFRDETSPPAAPCREALAALNCLERAVRGCAVNVISEKNTLVETLAELGDAVDLLRRSCIEIEFTAQQVHCTTELQRVNREFHQFAYAASHDLQEPLRKIRTFGNRLAAGSGERLDETGRECLERMQAAAGRMQVLIDGLLMLSRVSTSEQDFVSVDLADVAREVVSGLKRQIEQTNGHVDVGLLPTIEADAGQIRQLLRNLIGNALKFRSGDRPPEVKVHGRLVAGGKQRRGDTAGAGSHCRILVEDNGIGFDEVHLDRVFGVFQRLNPRELYEGAGIGLPICRRIVERHGGSITARSTPGSGTTFDVVLPVVQPKRHEET